MAAAAAAAAALPARAFAIGRKRNADPIRIGLIGCGGRGTGAARNAVEASENVFITALGDLFPDRMADARRGFDKKVTEDPRFAAAYKVKADHVFTGWDAYEKVLATDCDLVILATPPAFRATHLTAAVKAGKHVFAEKPVCVDVATAIQAYAAADLAKQKGLGYVAGTQRRHDPAYVDVIRRIHDGAIGDVITGQVYWNQGGLWSNARKPEWSDTEFQLRNWLYYTWARRCGPAATRRRGLLATNRGAGQMGREPLERLVFPDAHLPRTARYRHRPPAVCRTRTSGRSVA